tara:strand:+ start:602 stop:1369 length:768 start_codon:yes stop_codon:yes gene_type:complete
MFDKLFFLIIALFFLSACSSKKQVLYLQGIKNNDSFNYEYEEYKIKVDDILKIEVSSQLQDPENLSLFDFPSNNISINNKDILLLDGYQVGKDGTINFSNLGKIKVANLTIDEIESLFTKMIKDEQILIDPMIDVKVMNSHFTIIGEVNQPGRHDFLQNNLNIFEAIGMAGDLTINGRRDNVKIMRDNDGDISITEIDLTNQFFGEKKLYQIQNSDIIIISPNTNRIKNAGIIGNSGTLLSLLSFLLSSIIIITR